MPKKPKPPKNLILIEKNRAFGDVPAYIGLAHRHFEKEMPLGAIIKDRGNGSSLTERGTYLAPVDLAAMVLPVEYVEQIDSIELEYERNL